jgi:uncharacterized protein YndB with AHSA1/START domain
MAERKGSELAASDTAMALRSDREIVITRTFNGAARAVFDAWTRPDLVKRWWAPKSHRVEIVDCQADVRAGGAYRYLLRKDGTEFGFSGTYTEVTRPTRLVYTQSFEPMAGAGAVVVTVTFDEHDGRTQLVAHELYPSKAARDGALASGMEHGMRETMDQLDELVVSLR